MRTTVDRTRDILSFYKLASLRVFWRHLKFFVARLCRLESLTANVFHTSLVVPLRWDGIGRALYVHQGREPDHKWMLEQVLRPNDVIFDVGSNIGYYAVLQATLLERQCFIYCVEPDPRNVDFLSANIRRHHLSEKVNVEQCAIGDYDGPGRLNQDARTNHSALADGSTQQNGKSIQVTVHDFARYLKSIGRPVDVVRMDIEGGELKVLRSLIAAFSKDPTFVLPRTIIFETHLYGDKQDEMKALMSSLFAIGYRLRFLSSGDENNAKPALHRLGYRPTLIIRECGGTKGLYQDVSEKDAASAISSWRATRTVCIGIDAGDSAKP